MTVIIEPCNNSRILYWLSAFAKLLLPEGDSVIISAVASASVSYLSGRCSMRWKFLLEYDFVSPPIPATRVYANHVQVKNAFPIGMPDDYRYCIIIGVRILYKCQIYETPIGGKVSKIREMDVFSCIQTEISFFLFYFN